MKRIETVYGFFPGGDPREFSPDYESNSQEEIEAWKEACRLANEAEERGEQPVGEPPACRPLVSDTGEMVGRAIHASFGLGVYSFEWDDEESA